MVNSTKSKLLGLWNDERIKEFLLYVIAGSIAFASDFTVLYFSTEIVGVHYLISNLISSSFGLLVAYLLNIHWVFKYRRYPTTVIELPIFISIAIAGMLISELLLFIMVEKSSINYLWAKIMIAGIIFLFNFVIRKRLLFSK